LGDSFLEAGVPPLRNFGFFARMRTHFYSCARVRVAATALHGRYECANAGFRNREMRRPMVLVNLHAVES